MMLVDVLKCAIGTSGDVLLSKKKRKKKRKKSHSTKPWGDQR
jgi:hypothetical protein